MSTVARGPDADPFEIALEPLPGREQLAELWRALEARSDASFYLGWSWIGCWLQAIDGAVVPRLLHARRAGSTVGLALLVHARLLRGGIVPLRSLHLHATGHPQYDMLTIEYNGLLVERGLEEALVPRMLEHAARAAPPWDQFVLDALERVPDWPAPGAAGLRRSLRVEADHYVDLAAVRAAPDYAALLGTNTRAQLRRSQREFERLGPLAVREAADPAEALGFLEALGQLHQAYWVGRGEPGAFANPHFVAFHRRLVAEAHGRGAVQLLAIDAGSRRLGYLYNFVHRGRVLNYQSGFDYGLGDKHNRPGFVAHACAVAFNAGRGLAVYDFLAGDTQYKRSLGTATATLAWLEVQRPGWRGQLAGAARALRGHLAGH